MKPRMGRFTRTDRRTGYPYRYRYAYRGGDMPHWKFWVCIDGWTWTWICDAFTVDDGLKIIDGMDMQEFARQWVNNPFREDV